MGDPSFDACFPVNVFVWGFMVVARRGVECRELKVVFVIGRRCELGVGYGGGMGV